ncbi:MAG: hypothetical protein FWD22_01975 [Treponema sp.]|nr:hypothetical protein [Treponema sp.]
MKKLVMFAIIACLAVGFVFAQSYTVESVTGSVQRESGNSRVNLRPGEILNADTVIHTAAESTLVLKFGERTINIPAARSGKVSELATSVSSLRIGQNVSRVETGAATRVTGQASTASARASAAARSPNIAEEDDE